MGLPISSPENKITDRIISWVAVAASTYHLILAFYSTTELLVQRTVSLSFFLVIVFLGGRGKRKGVYHYTSLVLAVMVVIFQGYYLSVLGRFLTRWPMVDPVFAIDIIMGITLMVLVFEATRRTIGWGLYIVGLVTLLYVFLGPYIPGQLHHLGFSLPRIVDFQLMSTEGIYGVALGVTTSYIMLFIIFGSVLKQTGAGDFVITIASKLGGRSPGGPAKIAVVASALFGTISGAPTANVLATGVFTIPLMKRVGYKKEFAGAVEAVASSGGAILPPVMGSIALLMADFTGIAYIDIAIAALLPALLYYFYLYVGLDFRARIRGLRGLSKEELAELGAENKTLLGNGIQFLIPVVVLVVVLMSGYSPATSAIYGIFAAIGCNILICRRKWMGFKGIIATLEDAGRSAPVVFVAVAMAGFIVGNIILTGVGGKFSSVILGLAGGNLFPLLLLGAIVNLILGMGVPIVAAYILVSVTAVPALISLNISPMAAHLFSVYFAAFSVLTPPVAIAAYAASSISGGDPLKTGLYSVRLALVGFIVPFVWVYRPQLLLGTGYPWWEGILLALVVALACIAANAALEGWFIRKIEKSWRIVLALTALLLIWPGTMLNVAGVIAIGVILIVQKKLAGNSRTREQLDYQAKQKTLT